MGFLPLRVRTTYLPTRSRDFQKIVQYSTDTNRSAIKQHRQDRYKYSCFQPCTNFIPNIFITNPFNISLLYLTNNIISHNIFVSFEKKYRWSPSIQPYQTGPRCWSKQRSTHRSTLHGRTTLLYTPPSKGPGRSSERFFHKSKRSFGWRIFSLSLGKHLLGSRMNSDKAYKLVMIPHHRPFILRKRLEL